ncbi:hypothetical protein V6N13_007992 [Hibiscus sabdariffa]
MDTIPPPTEDERSYRKRLPRHCGNGGNQNEINPLGSSTGDEMQEFFGGAGFREEDEDVGRGECANVAVEGIERGEEGGADAERNQGLGDLIGDEPRFFDAREENGAAGMKEGFGER